MDASEQVAGLGAASRAGLDRVVQHDVLVVLGIVARPLGQAFAVGVARRCELDPVRMHRLHERDVARCVVFLAEVVEGEGISAAWAPPSLGHLGLIFAKW